MTDDPLEPHGRGEQVTWLKKLYRAWKRDRVSQIIGAERIPHSDGVAWRIRFPNVAPSATPASSGGEVQCVVNTVLDDILICTPLAGGAQIAVAKPYLLRRATWDGNPADNMAGGNNAAATQGTYSYPVAALANSKPQERLLSMPTGAMPDNVAATFLQIIVPLYNSQNTQGGSANPQQQIVACKPDGGTGLVIPNGFLNSTTANPIPVIYEDVNNDSREFWTQFPVCWNGFPGFMWSPLYPPFKIAVNQ